MGATLFILSLVSFILGWNFYLYEHPIREPIIIKEIITETETEYVVASTSPEIVYEYFYPPCDCGMIVEKYLNQIETNNNQILDLQTELKELKRINSFLQNEAY